MTQRLNEHTVQVDATTIHAVSVGDGPALLLIHGLGWDHRLWQPEIERLSRDYRVIAMDLRGHGRSGKPDMRYTIDLFAQDALSVLEALRVRCAGVVGFSLGGTVAMRLALQAPERIGALVLACCGFGSSGTGEAGTEAMLSRAMTLGPWRFAEEQAEAIWRPEFRAANPELVERFVKWRANMDQAALARSFRSGYGIDLRGELPSVACPALVMAADQDPFVPLTTAETIAGIIPDAELFVIENCGHMAMQEQPERFTGALDSFLACAWPAQIACRRRVA